MRRVTSESFYAGSVERFPTHKVIIESPYAGDREAHDAYLRECMKDSISRGEAPFASHALYTQVLNDAIPEQREVGIRAGFAWGEVADKVVVYCDLGISAGMQAGITFAESIRKPVEFRHLRGEWKR